MNNYSYNELAKFIKSGRSKIERKVENNTTARFEGNNIIVKLHSTNIAIIQPDNTVSLYSGGYKTMTTKDRMRKIISPFALGQENGIWFISKNWRDNERFAFADGITIYPNGLITDYNEDWKDTVKLRRDIRKYAKGFITALINGEVSKPDLGDCFYCHMREVNNNIPLGEVTNNTDHLESHIEENYYVPSLFYRACEVCPMCNFANGTMYQLWYTEDKISNWQKDILQRDGYKSLVKYLYQQFGLPY